MALKASHRTATALTSVGVALIVAGGAWLAGPLVLIGAGLVLMIVGLFVIDDSRRS